MKTFRLITAMVLIVGLIAVFSAFSAEQTTKGKEEDALTESQQSKDQQKTPATAMQSQPLAIQKLYLKDDTVRVILVTTGNGKVQAKDYAKVKLTVEMTGLKKPGKWTLLQVDPKRRLSRIKGKVDFDTGMEVRASKEVKVDKQVKLNKQMKIGKHVKATLSFGLWKTAKVKTLSSMMAESSGEQKKEQPHQRVGPMSASRLPIEILTPSSGRIFRRGQTMYINYRIITPTEAGEVLFRLLSSVHGEVATTTHYYEPPDLSGVDFSDAEIEPTGGGPLGTDVDDGEPLGIGDVVFAWTLPSDDSIPYGNDYYVRAHKGGLQGRSATFRIAPPASLYGGTGIEVDVLGSGLTPGSDLVVRYYCWGCDCEHVGTNIYLHREIHGFDPMAYDLASARSGSEITETLRIPEDIPPARDYVITLWGGTDCWGESNTFPILGSSTETDFRVIRPNGGEGWQLGTTQLIRWSVANLFGAGSSEEPDARYSIQLLRDGVPVLDIPQHWGIEYDSETQTCSVPWLIPTALSPGGSHYKIRVQAENRAEPSAAPLTAESAENFTICTDCMVEHRTSRNDLWIEGVRIGSSTGAYEDHDIVDYYTDDGPTGISVTVGIGWNGERPLPMCQPVVRIYLSDMRYTDTGDYCTAREFTIADSTLVYAGIILQPGLTPGSIIPLRAEIVCGNEAIDARSRSALDICEGRTDNNQHDFSVTLRDAGSR